MKDTWFIRIEKGVTVMNASARRQEIVDILRAASAPVSAGMLARKLGVSRQIIVGDVALLRASGADVAATPRGYLLSEAPTEGKRFTVACQHTKEQITAELYAVVDNGGEVLDVIVEHAVYGQIAGALHLTSRFEVDEFVKKLSTEQALPLSSLTDGVHLHTILCRDTAMFERIRAALRRERVLFEA